MAKTYLHGRQVAVGTLTDTQIAENAAIGRAKLADSANYFLADGTVPMTAGLNMNNFGIRGLVNPSQSDEAATKSYVDASVQGLSPKDPCVVATAENIDLASGGLLTIQTVTLLANNRVLVMAQTDPKQNGIYDAKAGAWVRSGDADNTPNAEVRSGVYVYVERGNFAGNGLWITSPNSMTYTIGGKAALELGVDDITFSQFTGAAQLTAGLGLSKTGNTFDVVVGYGIEIVGDAVEVQINTDTFNKNTGPLRINNQGIVTVMIATDAVDKTKINADVAGDGIGQNADGSLEVNVDGSTVEIAGDVVRVKDSGIVTVKIAADAVDKTKINADVAGNGLGQNADGSLEVNVDGSTVELYSDAVRVKDSGITTAKIATDAVDKTKINADVAGNGLGQNADGSIEITTDGTSLEVYNDTLQIKASGVSTAKIANDAVNADKLNSSVAGGGITGGGGTALAVGAGYGIQVNSDDVQVKLASSSGLVCDTNGLRVSGDTMTTGRIVAREIASGLVDGSNAVFDLSQTPIAGSECVFMNGLLMEPGAGADYTISSATVTFNVGSVPQSGDKLRINYVY